MVSVPGNHLSMMMNADNCQLIIKMKDNQVIYQAEFEFASLSAEFNDGIVIPYFYHPMQWDDSGRPIERRENPEIRVLRIDKLESIGSISYSRLHIPSVDL